MPDDSNLKTLHAVRSRARRPLTTVFGSSSPNAGDAEYELAYEVGRLLAARGHGVVNGGYGGTMAASARGARDAGGYSVGVTIEGAKWRPNGYLNESVGAASHLDRLLMLVELGERFVVLPGGTGTLLELAYVWECLNKRFLSNRPLILFGERWNAVAEQIVAEQPYAGRHIVRAADLNELADHIPDLTT